MANEIAHTPSVAQTCRGDTVRALTPKDALPPSHHRRYIIPLKDTGDLVVAKE